MTAHRYKTVELDGHIGGGTEQVREVQGRETAAFKALFPRLKYLTGGISSGLR